MEHPHLFIAAASLLLGAAAGWVMHRADFCTAGMFRDLFLFRSTFMLRMLLPLFLVAMLTFEGGRMAGLYALPFPGFGYCSLLLIPAGALFGIGMVLAGGCVAGTLYKLGAGNLLGAATILGLIAGSALYGEIHSGWMRLLRLTALSHRPLTLPQVLGIAPGTVVAAAALLLVVLFLSGWRRPAWQRPAFASGYLQPWRAALLLGFIGGTSAVLVGLPLGIATAYAKTAGWLESHLFSEHFAAASFFALESVNYVHPLLAGTVRGGFAPALDGLAAIQFPLIAGIVLGSAASALRLGEFRLRIKAPPRQFLSAFIGGALMGMGTRMGGGCNIWHLWGGLPTFTLSSFLFLAGLFPGAWLGSRILATGVIRWKEGNPP